MEKAVGAAGEPGQLTVVAVAVGVVGAVSKN